MRSEGTGEELIDGMTRDAFGSLLRQTSRGLNDAAIHEYWKAFGDDDRRRGQLELYRSGDFDKLEPYEGKLAELGVPALVLWGEEDPFASVAGAHRFYKELPGSELAVVEGAGHFVYADAEEITGFLGQ
jgi:haloalkane dehalogenase